MVNLPDMQATKIIYTYFEENKFFKVIENKGEFAQIIWETYKDWGIDKLIKEFRKMSIWLMSNPKRLKKDYKKFIINWLARVDNSEQKTRILNKYTPEPAEIDKPEDYFERIKKLEQHKKEHPEEYFTEEEFKQKINELKTILDPKEIKKT